MKILLNLGCGKDIRKSNGGVNIINADRVSEFGADKVFNMEDGLPFKDDYFDEILAYNCLEQLSTPQKFLFVMNELHRILKPMGKMILRVPNVTDICAFQDIFDVLKFNKNSFDYMDYKNVRYKEFGVIYGFKPFNVTLMKEDRQLTFGLQSIK